MEKVWAELKKIEAEAEQIRSEAQNKSKEITTLAQQEAENLQADGKTYAEQEAKQLYTNTINEANRKRDEQLKANQEATEKIRAQAEKRMDQAALAIVNSVLGEQAPWARQHFTPAFSPKSAHKEANSSAKLKSKR